MKKFIILITIVLLTAVSCSTPRYVSEEPMMKSEWIGRHHSEIIHTFGAPTREVSDLSDGWILVYERINMNTYETEYGSRSEEQRDFKEFYIGADGICYDVRTNAMVQKGRKIHILGPVLVGTLAVCLFICGGLTDDDTEPEY